MEKVKDKTKKTKVIDIDSAEEENTAVSKEGAEDRDNVIQLAERKSSAVKRFTIGSVILFVFLILYIPSLINWMSGNSLARDVIRNGVIEESVNADAVIIRDEKLLDPLASGGRLIYEIGEGEKTPAFSRIATVLNEASSSLLQKMEDINAKIIKARMEKAEKADFFSEDLVKLDKEIGLKVGEVITACNAQDFEKLSECRSEIEKIVEKKAEIAGGNSTDTYINDLKAQKEALQKKLNENTGEVKSNISGIVSYCIDGYENVLTPAGIQKLTPDLIEGVLEKNAVGQNAGKNAAAGKPPAKIIKGTDIYIAAVLGSDYAGEYKTGDNIIVRINDANIETSAVIAAIGNDGGGKSVITVRISRGADILSDVRKVNVDFINKKEEGLKVPARCLRNFSKDRGQADITLVKYNVATVLRVDIVCINDEYAIIKTSENEDSDFTVNLYDIYILNPDNIKEGEIVQK